MKYDGIKLRQDAIRNPYTSRFYIVDSSMEHMAKLESLNHYVYKSIVSPRFLLYLFVIDPEFRRTFSKCIFHSKEDNGGVLYVDRQMILSEVNRMPANSIAMLFAIKNSVDNVYKNPLHLSSVIRELLNKQKEKA